MIFAGVWLGSVRAETITLKMRNGDRLTGDVVSESATNLVLNTPWARDVIVPKDQISLREKVPITTAQTPATTPSPIAVITANNTNQPPPKPATPPATQASATKPKPPSNWHGEVQIGTDLRFSEKDRQLYYSRMKLIYARELQPKRLFKNIFDYNAAYGEADGILSDNRMEGSIKTDYDLSRRFFGYNLAGAGYDEIRKIDFRLEVGPGLGYHLFARTNYIMNLEVGANYQARYYSDSRKDERIYCRFAEDATWKISNKMTLDEKFEFFPRPEDFGNYRLRFETNYRYLLLQNLSFNLTLLDLYDTEPARTVTRNDLQVRSSLGLKF